MSGKKRSDREARDRQWGRSEIGDLVGWRQSGEIEREAVVRRRERKKREVIGKVKERE